MKRKKIIIGAAIVVVLAFIFWLSSGGSSDSQTILVPAKKGDFKITVTTSGELEAKSSLKIYGPQGLQQVGIWRVNIEDIIPDGTLVDSGQYVARLDMSEISNKIKDKETELEKLETQVTKTRIDTSIEMRAARDELLNMRYSVEEKKIILEQSKYEPPATIRQNEIAFEKAERALEQAVKNYQLKLQKNRASMQDVTASYDQAKRQLESFVEVRNQFTITAPERGMLIYRRNWDGKKMGVGAQISGWDNVVATLPDLSKMITKTYVNEIDISKVKVNQKVDISIDAFPDKKLSGVVTEVANIGEQLSGASAKVFEVTIAVNEFDSILRPAMTTKNVIITAVIPNQLYIPIEAIHNSDSITWVATGKKRRQVLIGETNENEIVIKKGLKEGEQVYLTLPTGAEKWPIEKIEE
ncbi:MAG: efflux RND transporter periplasmic adaptor subunit [Sphingobacteriia bacterium]|nr:efflux RND transporter periplasmic adaptor subunit [Sphingobacteriia bacterium]